MQKQRWMKWLLVALVTVAFTACGGGGSGGDDTHDGNDQTKKRSVLIDSPLVGITYECEEPKGLKKTDSEGRFQCEKAPVTFKIGGLVLGVINDLNNSIVFPQDLLGLPRNDFENRKLIALLRLLQSIDDDGNISDAITITEEMSEKFGPVEEDFDENRLDDYAMYAGEVGTPVALVTKEEAKRHLLESMQKALRRYMPKSHELDGKTIYYTECIYHIADEVEDDYIEYIAPGLQFNGSETIGIMKFENGFLTDMGLVGVSISHFGQEFGIQYGISDIGFYFGHPLRPSEDDYNIIRVNQGGKYYANIHDGDEDWEILRFFDTADQARAYIQRVYSKAERTCEVSQ